MVNLPDFDDIERLINEISNKGLEKGNLELEIKDKEAGVTMTVTTDSTYFINGKAPSQAFIDRTYLFTGLSGELLPLRRRLNEVTAEYNRLKNLLDLLSSRIEVWRSEQANIRSTQL